MVLIRFYVSFWVHDAIIKVNNKKINASLKFNVKREWNFMEASFISHCMANAIVNVVQ